MNAFNSTSAVASRGYSVYTTTSWVDAKVGNKVTVELEKTVSLLEADRMFVRSE